MDLFDLVAKITLDSSEYEKGIKGAGEGASALSSKWATFGKVAAGVGVATAAAVGAAAVGVGKLTKASIEAYSNYEQLAGGVEKIFDQANTEQIFADANNAYKNLNMSANQYLAAINQTGAAFAQTMGDQKGYETAKTGMQAIADYASGTGRDLNELNDKYALITRSTSSYQSIADQFSGILPATSKGFLEQAQAAGFLSDSYSTLTDVPIDEYQEAVTKMLEKGVTDMGLYGNTAKESATTIQGSLAMTKAAWENLVAGFADPDADLGQLMDNLVVAIVGENEGEGLLNQIIPAIERAMEGIGTLIEEAAPILAEHLPKLIEEILPSLLNAATQLIAGIVQALPSLISVLVQQMPMIISTLVSALLTLGGELVSTGAELLSDLSSGIKSGFEALWRNVVSWARKIPQAIKSGVGNLWSIGANMIDGLWNGIKSKFDSVISRVKEMAAKLPEAVKKVLGIESPSKVFAEVGRWIPEGLALGIENNLASVQSAADAMAGATAITPTFGNTGLLGATEGEFGRLNAVLQEWLPQLTNMDIVLDSGALVGELSRTIDSTLGARQKNRERGNA